MTDSTVIRYHDDVVEISCGDVKTKCRMDQLPEHHAILMEQYVKLKKGYLDGLVRTVAGVDKEQK